MSKTTVWLSYDLGIRGDYPSLYAWLDKHDAKECGDSFAVFVYDHDNELEADLLADLRQSIDFNDSGRIYVIFRDRETGNRKGKFLVGGRRAPPWTGYAAHATVEDEEIAE